jgi:hypothetical protein
MEPAIIFLICFIFLIVFGLLLFFVVKISKTTGKSTGKGTGNDSGGSSGSGIIDPLLNSLQNGAPLPTINPPDPAAEESLYNKIIEALVDFAEMATANALFDKLLNSLAPDEIKTWKAIFGNNEELKTKFKTSAQKALETNANTQIKKAKTAKDLVNIGSKDVNKLVNQTATRAVAEAEATTSRLEGYAIRIGRNFAGFLAAGPLDAALLAVNVASIALDEKNVGGLQNWESQTTRAFADIKKKQDDDFNASLQSSGIKPPLIAGPLDDGTGDYTAVLALQMIYLITGVEKVTDRPDYQKTLDDIRSQIIMNFLTPDSSTPPDPTDKATFIKKHMSFSIMSAIGDYSDQLAIIGMCALCQKSDGVFIANLYCSYKQTDCTVTPDQWAKFQNGTAHTQYTVWKSASQLKIPDNACAVQPYQVRQACSVGKKDISGKMQYNNYDPIADTCTNTKEFCDAYGLKFTGNTCYQDSADKVFSMIFGNTIVQGVNMVDTVVNRGIISILAGAGPAGKFVGAIYTQINTVSRTLTCSICTLFTNGFDIVKDIFTGNFKDIEKLLVSDAKQVKNIFVAIGGFFKAIIYDFIDLFS